METNKGNLRSTTSFIVEFHDVDEEYQAYIETLTREELEEELMMLKAEYDAIRGMDI